MKYRYYDPIVKKMIEESRNPNLFPELNIPRITALYWIDKAKFRSSKIRIKGALYSTLL